jgi:hypothetical protein
LEFELGAANWHCRLALQLEGDCSSLDASQIDHLRFTKNQHQTQVYQVFLDDLHVVQRLTEEFMLFKLLAL